MGDSTPTAPTHEAFTTAAIMINITEHPILLLFSTFLILFQPAVAASGVSDDMLLEDGIL